nr:hypothetical protein Iba_chr11fCG4700 [Ipomoea batatas]
MAVFCVMLGRLLEHNQFVYGGTSKGPQISAPKSGVESEDNTNEEKNIYKIDEEKARRNKPEMQLRNEIYLSEQLQKMKWAPLILSKKEKREEQS